MKYAGMLRISSLVLASLSFASPLTPTCAAQSYSVSVLPTLSGLKGTNNKPNVIYGMNRFGQITGVSPSPNDGPHAFLWTPGGGILDLGTGKYSQGAGVNDLGHVAGSYIAPNGEWNVFLWTPDDGIQDLGTAQARSFAYGVNNLDQIIGTIGSQAFLWTPGTSEPEGIGTLGGPYSIPSHINDAGQIVGWADTNPQFNQAPFFWTQANGMQEINGLAGASTINESGQVVGGTEAGHAALWTNSGGTQDLGVLPGMHYSLGLSINNRGVAVGNSYANYPGFVFLWSPTQGMLNVNTLSKNKNQNWTPVAINDAGQIAINKKGGVALLLTPIVAVAASSSLNPSHLGQSVTLTATASSIAGPPPDGENVTFMDSTAVLGSAPLINGSASITLSTLGVGTHLVTAGYTGDVNYAAASSKGVRQKVKP